MIISLREDIHFDISEKQKKKRGGGVGGGENLNTFSICILHTRRKIYKYAFNQIWKKKMQFNI